MKSLKYLLLAVTTALICSSCLESNLKELDVYDGAEITSAQVYYRYVDESFTFPLSGAHSVKQSTLNVANTIDTDASTLDIVASLPANFPESEVANISTKLLVVSVSISTAAVLKPVDDSPALGVPADWSTPHKYIVTAADGTKKEWTISVTLNK